VLDHRRTRGELARRERTSGFLHCQAWVAWPGIR
jgi:hypothetical protein